MFCVFWRNVVLVLLKSCLLKTNFFESTLGNLTSTYNFVDFWKNKKEFSPFSEKSYKTNTSKCQKLIVA